MISTSAMKTIYIELWSLQTSHLCKYRLRYWKWRKVGPGRWSSTDTTVNNSHENAELPEFFCMADYMNDCTDSPVEEGILEAFNVEVEKQNHVVSAAGTILRICKECSNRFLEEGLHFLHSSGTTSSDYIIELPTLKESIKKYIVSVCDKLLIIKVITELVRSTGCGGLEKRDQVCRYEMIKVLQKQFALAKEEYCD